MHRAGVATADIAEQLGYADHSAVSHLIARHLQRAINTNVEEVRKYELDRLSALQTSYWSSARKGDEKSAEMVLKILDRRRKYIGGLEVTQQLSVDTHDSTEERLRAALEALGAIKDKHDDA